MNRFSVLILVCLSFPAMAQQILPANSFPGSDIGAQINSAYADLPAAGGTIQVYIPAGGLSFSTPVAINTASKPAKIVCLSNSGLPYSETRNGLTYTGSGAAMTFDAGGNSGVSNTLGGWGLYGCPIYGNSSGIGVMLGGLNGATGAEIMGSTIAGFATPLQFGRNTYHVHVSHSLFNGTNPMNIPSGLSNFGESMNFDNVFFLGSSIASSQILIDNPNMQLTCTACSFDDMQLQITTGDVVLINPHFENPSKQPLTRPLIVSTAAEVNLISPQFFGNSTSGTTAAAMFEVDAGSMNITSMASSAFAGFPYMIKVAGTANVTSLEPHYINNGFAANAYVTGTTTGVYRIETTVGTILSNAPRVFSSVGRQLLATSDEFNRTGIGLHDTGNLSEVYWTGTPDTAGYWHAHIKGSECGYTYGSQLQFFTEQKVAANGTDTSTQTGVLDCNGDLSITGAMSAASLKTTQSPTASTTPSDHSVPIVLDGTTYYIRLSTRP